MAQPQSITSSTTAKGAAPTQGVTIDHVYAAVDYSKKTSRRRGKLKVLTTLTFCIHATTEDSIYSCGSQLVLTMNCVLLYDRHISIDNLPYIAMHHQHIHQPLHIYS